MSADPPEPPPLPEGWCMRHIVCRHCGNPADVKRACCPRPYDQVRTPQGRSLARARYLARYPEEKEKVDP